jgi:hypothetical protein
MILKANVISYAGTEGLPYACVRGVDLTHSSLDATSAAARHAWQQAGCAAENPPTAAPYFNVSGLSHAN